MIPCTFVCRLLHVFPRQKLRTSHVTPNAYHSFAVHHTVFPILPAHLAPSSRHVACRRRWGCWELGKAWLLISEPKQTINQTLWHLGGKGAPFWWGFCGKGEISKFFCWLRMWAGLGPSFLVSKPVIKDPHPLPQESYLILWNQNY